MSELNDLIYEFDSEDAMIAVQAATQTAKLLGEDLAITINFEVVPLRAAKNEIIEIVRCPFLLRKE